MVSPIRKATHLYELSVDELDDLFRVVRLSTIALINFGIDFTVYVQDGPLAGQTVDHVHVHILARNENDIDDHDKLYANGVLEYVKPTKSFDEMKDETEKLRKEFTRVFKEHKMDFVLN